MEAPKRVEKLDALCALNFIISGLPSRVFGVGVKLA